MYMAASGVSTEMARMDVSSNNLSNANTVGFRSVMAAARFRPAVREEDGLPFANSNRMLERLGAGSWPTQTMLSLDQGPLEKTERSLDIAIQGDGWLTARVGAGAESTRLTRDGRLAIDPLGRVVLAGTGAAVLDDEGTEIVVDPRAGLVIHPDGSVEQAGSIVGRLGIVDVTDSSMLVPEGAGLHRIEGRTVASLAQSVGSVVHQGMVEQSSVDPIDELMTITSASSSAQRNMRMVGLIAQNMQLAVSRLGRVA